MYPLLEHFTVCQFCWYSGISKPSVRMARITVCLELEDEKGQPREELRSDLLSTSTTWQFYKTFQLVNFICFVLEKEKNNQERNPPVQPSSLSLPLGNSLSLPNQTTHGRSPPGQAFCYLSNLSTLQAFLIHNQFCSIGEGQLREDPHLVGPSVISPTCQLSKTFLIIIYFCPIGEGQIREDPHLVRPSQYLPNLAIL